MIDVHAHYMSRDVLAALQRHVPQLAPSLVEENREVTLVFPDGHRAGPCTAGMVEPGPRLAVMDKQGVATQLVSAPPGAMNYDAPAALGARATRIVNDGLIELAAAHPDSFKVMAGLPLQDADAAVAELERISGVAEVVGVMLGTNVAGANLDDSSLAPVWAELSSRSLPVLLHPYRVAGIDRLRKHYLRNLIGNPLDTTIAAASLIFGGVLDRYPLSVCLVHGGGFLPYQISRWDRGYESRPDVAPLEAGDPSNYLRRFYYDCVLHDAQTLAYLASMVGWDRILMGTDYPFDMGVEAPGELIDAACADSPSQLHAVGQANIAAFLGREGRS